MRSAMIFCTGPAAALAVPPPVPLREPLAVALSDARDAMSRGDPAAALDSFERALLLAPRMGVALLGRAVCLATLHRPEADAALAAVLERAETEPALLLDLARASAREGQAGFAIELVGCALRIDPDLAEGLAQNPGLAPLHDHPAFLQVSGAL